MIGAAQDWLEARVPFDDAARQQSLPLLDRAAQALLAADPTGRTPLTVVDLGAGTGKSAAWFRRHLSPRLPGRSINWLLVDAHEPSLEIATQHLTDADTVVTPLSDLPAALDNHLPERPAPGTLMLTCSAVLDVLTQDDVEAILTTLTTHHGVGLFLLSITADWHLEPADPRDPELAQAFADHQRRDGKLGAEGGEAMLRTARERGIHTTHGNSAWQLNAPRDTEFTRRFLTERVAAAVEASPELEVEARDWLETRNRQAADHLNVTVDHCDVLVDARRDH
ncbi:hypothetical protein [Kocuria sp. cx-455]|uniref:hypothetical protein n=1 Tax=Kocuria sp. cx-455 TaxID=2771377 RepID=UPI003D73F3E6